MNRLVRHTNLPVLASFQSSERIVLVWMVYLEIGLWLSEPRLQVSATEVALMSSILRPPGGPGGPGMKMRVRTQWVSVSEGNTHEDTPKLPWSPADQCRVCWLLLFLKGRQKVVVAHSDLARNDSMCPFVRKAVNVAVQTAVDQHWLSL